MTHRNMITVVFVTVLLVTGCSTSPVDSVDSALATHFLDPLREADISYAVENTCHLQRHSDTEPWHLEVRVKIDADRDRLPGVFEARDVVVVRDRNPMTIQQEPDDSAGGWNGVLEARVGGASSLGLTYNNVALDGVAEAGGWAEVCRLADDQ